MYFPYLRGKEFELLALLEIDPKVYANTIPIIEPVTKSDRRKMFAQISNLNFPFLLIVNPYYPTGANLSMTEVQKIIDSNLSTHDQLTIGFLIDNRFQISALRIFLADNPTLGKALIFRHNPLPNDMVDIEAAIQNNDFDYLVFDEKRTNTSTQSRFVSHNQRVLLTDGFQRQDKNSNYPTTSTFDCNITNWKKSGWFGIGDYITVGDYFQEGGGQVYVVTLHLTSWDGTHMITHHFSSTKSSSIRGLAASKFIQANSLLNNSPVIIPLNSSGLAMYREWHKTQHNPHLGAAKQASIMHHIELMSSIL